MDFDEIVVKESPGLCRCCLSEGCYKDMGTEYTWMNDNEVYADMLLECFDIGISQHNDGPNGPNRLICEVCITRLRDACNFKKQVLDSEKKFVDMIGRGEFRPKVLIYQSQMKAERNDDGVEDAEVEYLDEDLADFDEDDLPLKREGAGAPPRAAAEPLPLPKRGRPKKTAVKPEKKKKLEDRPKVKSVVKDEYGPTAYSCNKIRRRNLKILFNHTTIIPFKWRGKYICFYCGDFMASYHELRTHTKSHGECTEKDRAMRLVRAKHSEVKIDVSYMNCNLCKESFSDFDDIIFHLNTKHTKLHYNRDVDLTLTKYRLEDLKCISCDESFSCFSRLIRHVNVNHPVNCFTCDFCENKKFNKKRDLECHLRNRHKSSYVCSKCVMVFPNNATLQNHRAHAHASTCNVCFEPFSSDSKRVSHMKEYHLDDDVLQCGFCLKKLNTKLAFLNHASKCNVNDDSKQYEDSIDSDKKSIVAQIRNNIACIVNMSTALPFKFYMSKFRCFYCPKDFQECDDLKEHTVAEHPKCDSKLKSMRLRSREYGLKIKLDVASLSCKVCFAPIKDLETLINHLVTKHKAQYDKTVENNLQPFKLIKDNFACPFCGEVFRYFSSLLKHVSQSHTDNRIICVYCGKAFRTDPSLRAHISLRHRPRRYKCKSCDLHFTSKSSLQNHSGKAHGTKVAGCPECCEKFTSQYSMQRHMMFVHGKGYKCSYCGKLFTKNSFMVNHIRRTHLKEKNVECSICFERFFDVHLLRMHTVKHVGERNFHCDVCGKKFLWKKNLKGHMSSHVVKVRNEART